MKKIILSFEEAKNIQANDIIIFNGRNYTTLSKAAFLRELIEEQYKLTRRLEEAERCIKDLEKQLKIDHGEDVE